MKIKPLDAPALTTERLQLRMLQDADFEEYAVIHMDPLNGHRLIVYGVRRA